MIRVLVVDDDKLVRKGLISAMPWQEFGMQVVGEANNGAKALEFLESQPVDLLLTDLAMPVMSGIELMRTARKHYPHLHMVVLTLHQDFEYIQEALRLGAIDYIAKVQLEKEQFEEVLGRIAGRISEQMPQSRQSQKTFIPDEVNEVYEKGFVLLSLDRESGPNGLHELKLEADDALMEADRSSWIGLPMKGEESRLFETLSEKARTLPASMLLILSDLHGRSWKEIQQWVRAYAEKELFYEYRPDCPIASASMKDGFETYADPDDEQLARVKESWLTSGWFHNDDLYEKLIGDMKSLRLHKSQLLGLLYSLVMEWNRLFAQTPMGKIQRIHAFHSWFQVEQWLGKLRRDIQESTGHASYSQEIRDCITKAVAMVQAEIHRPLTAAQLAQRLNISRSYFSQCFKDIIGKTFNEFSRSVRIEKAKEYLLNTNDTIAWIAEQTGYSDEKYFSRIFRELTGMLPSEYRMTHRKGK
ncbi:two-component system response regulator [Paenibacillus elgii]|uniref:Two-component system response regulator n=1 Tax=Paenibacillus elgii TaxID=189691 RepID=A0A163ZJR9_9BACL|nr:helix-turn-helix domain-containing protein [Paenibacillus elgii]KZE81907.1 two-component system response regulator [Paenibacillus elgii]